MKILYFCYVRLQLDIRRHWRSRGHGVHSPLAFDLIVNTLCIRGKVAYYGYEAMSRSQRRALRIRVAAEAHGLPYNPAGGTTTSSCMLHGPATRVLPLATGLSFSDASGECVVVNRPDLPRQHFNLYFT